MKTSLLIAKDESSFHLLETFLKTKQIQVKRSKNLCLKEEHFDLIFCELSEEVLDYLSSTKIKDPLIGIGDPLNTALLSKALRLGIFHVLIKPLLLEHLEVLFEKFLEHKKERYPLVAQSPSMKKLLESLPNIARSSSSVFIKGESGTGKEVLATLLHTLSPRAHLPFIRVNCAAIPATLLESEFFGHEKGAFTGALQRRAGRFEMAHSGTLLLDEISEIPMELQPKLLRVIQEREFERLGGSKPIHVDVRLISTSNREMKEAISQKIFREDLFFRLHVIPIEIPPLRERTEDILPLAERFLQYQCSIHQRDPILLAPCAQDKLLSYSWPGNVRELSNVIERTIVMTCNKTIMAEDLILEFSCPIPTASQTLAEMEKTHILTTLKATGNNRSQAAKHLGISVRTLRNKLKLFL